MKIIHISQSDWNTKVVNGEPVACAFGFFDGLHQGHKVLVEAAKKFAQDSGMKSGMITFDPPPSVVLSKSDKVFEITPLAEKIRVLESWDIDFLFIIEFNQAVASIPHHDFLDALVQTISLRHVVVGFDFHYGFKGEGNAQTLLQYDKEHADFSLEVIAPQLYNGEKISSTAIRQQICCGNMSEANVLLARPYRVSGHVVHGWQRGRTIGFPTANIALDADFVLPRIGVYVVYFYIDGIEHQGIANVGYSPTIKNDPEPIIEVFIFDFDKDIYGIYAEVAFLDYIRGEKKFDSIDELVAQMHKDADYARNYFENE